MLYQNYKNFWHFCFHNQLQVVSLLLFLWEAVLNLKIWNLVHICQTSDALWQCIISISATWSNIYSYINLSMVSWADVLGGGSWTSAEVGLLVTYQQHKPSTHHQGSMKLNATKPPSAKGFLRRWMTVCHSWVKTLISLYLLSIIWTHKQRTAITSLSTSLSFRKRLKTHLFRLCFPILI